MLKVPDLNDINYDQMVQRAITRIPSMTNEWTDFNAHDPGITVLQAYAWLTDMLNYYMNATGELHVRKYLKLLNVEPKAATQARGIIIPAGVKEETIIPAGTRFYAGDIPFETVEDVAYTENRFTSCINEVDGEAIDLTCFAGMDGDLATIFGVEGKKSCVYLGFSKALEDGDVLYACVAEDSKRAHFGEDFSLSTLEYEVYTEDGWQHIDVKDYTGGFLKSDKLILSIDSKMTKWQHPEGLEPFYYIRITLKENLYDILPRLGRVYVNPIEVIQQSTICADEELINILKVGMADGTASQQYEFDYPDAWRFAIATVSKGGVKEIWNYTDNLDNAGYDERVFTYDYKEHIITFGDGIHGVVPEQYSQIYVTNLACSLLENGNVRPDTINTTDFSLLDGKKLECPIGAVGGCNEESVEEMVARLKDTLFAQNRMASPNDYIKRILMTPGLRIEMVHMIPGKKYGEIHHQGRSINEVVAIVKPYGTSPKAWLSDIYRERIEKYAEPYRLINTKLSVEPCRYVDINVHGKISLYADTEINRNRIMDYLVSQIAYENIKNPFGYTISYGNIFTGLEALWGVRLVLELSLEKDGSAADKNERGDIVLHEDAISFLGKVDLTFE